MKTAIYAGALRRELAERNRLWARGRVHVESYGADPVVVYAPETAPSGSERHGNFFDAAYDAIRLQPAWLRRFNKVHAQGKRSLPRPDTDPGRKWRELDSCMSSDALLMNIFCTPGVIDSPRLLGTLGLDTHSTPEFGWKARVPLRSGLFDRTEVDLRLGQLLIEAKLTESDFQTRKASIVEAYRDFDAVFDRDLLPRAAIAIGRRKHEVEFPEDYSQEFEEPAPTDLPRVEQWTPAPTEPGYAGYQLIRNVLAAYAANASFCVIHDARRPDLREDWFAVMTAVRDADMRTRLKVLTWQELAEFVPEDLRSFLAAKYGIVAGGEGVKTAWDLCEG